MVGENCGGGDLLLKTKPSGTATMVQSVLPDNGTTCGASDDLQIYHKVLLFKIKGRAFSVNDNGTGIHFMNDAQDEFLAKFQKDGEVILYQDNSARVTTTADGETLWFNQSSCWYNSTKKFFTNRW